MNTKNKLITIFFYTFLGCTFFANIVWGQFALNTGQKSTLLKHLTNKNDDGISAVFTDKAIKSIAISANSRYLVSSGAETKIQVWDAKKMEVVNQLAGHTDDVLSVTISPNSRLVASGGIDQQVLLWDLITGEMLHELAGHTDYVAAVHFSPDGKLLASGSWDKSVKIWSVTTGVLLHDFKDHPEKVSSIQFHPDGKHLITGCSDGQLRIWNIEDKKMVTELRGHQDEITEVTYSKSGKLAASSAWDNQVRVWNMQTNKEFATFSGHEADVWGVTFSPDEQLLATCGSDRTIKLWDLANQQLIATYGKNFHKADVEKVVFHPDGKRIISAGRDGSIRFWTIPDLPKRIKLMKDKIMADWFQRGKFEKTKDFEARLSNLDNRAQQTEALITNNIATYVNKYSDWDLDITVGEYNPDAEYFLVNLAGFGDFQLQVPIAEAEEISEQKADLTFHNVQATFGTKGIQIKKFEAHHKGLKRIYSVSPLDSK